MAGPKRFTAPVTVHLFLVREGQVLLLRRFNTGYEDGNYSVVAGHIDGGEPLWAAMRREAREEASIEIEREALKPVGVMHRRAGDERIDFFFTATEWSGEIINKEPHKCDELAFYPLDRLPENVIPYIRRALDNYRSGRWFDEFGWE